MSCGETSVSTHTPITDRELAEIEAGAQKPMGNPRRSETEGLLLSQFDSLKEVTFGSTARGGLELHVVRRGGEELFSL